MELSVINSIAIVVIIIAIIINMILSALTYKTVQQQELDLKAFGLEVREDIRALVRDLHKKMKEKVEKHTMNILDLDEFANLDPYIKDMYKKYIVDDLNPSLMDAINRDVRSYPSKDSVINEKELVSVIRLLAQQLRDNGLKVIPNSLTDTQKEGFLSLPIQSPHFGI